MRKAAFTLLIIIHLHINAQNDAWNISTINSENYTGVIVANGRIGILPSEKPFEIEQIILNNVYDKASPLRVSRILKGMNFMNLELEVDGEYSVLNKTIKTTKINF